MDVVGSVAGIAQLLSQAISLIQQVTEARETVRGYPKLLADYHGHLVDLQKTLGLVGDEKRLHAAVVVEQVEKLRDTALELHAFLKNIAEMHSRSATKAHIHAFTSGRRDEKELAEILSRLDRTGSALQTRIQLVLVAMTSTIHDKIVTSQPLICKSDMDTQGVLMADQSTDNPPAPGISEYVLCSQDSSPADNGEREAKHRATGTDKGDSPSAVNSRHIYVDNICLDQAHMVNGDVGSVVREQLASDEYRRNVAKGHSLQVNGSMDAESFKTLLAIRR